MLTRIGHPPPSVFLVFLGMVYYCLQGPHFVMDYYILHILELLLDSKKNALFILKISIN